MTAPLDKLIPAFKSLFEILLQKMDDHGYEPRVTWTIRTPVEQAKLWRQGRPLSQIKAKQQELDREGFDYLAHCLHEAGPQMGKNIVTNALPGQSWHQYGQAADVALFDYGKLITNGDHPAYKALANEADKIGLTTGIGWGDAGHVQFSSLPKPQYDLVTINNLMKQRFYGE